MLLVPIFLTTLALANNANFNVLGATLELRAIQTDALCSKEFDWAETLTGLTPCYVAAQVLGTCTSGNWNVPALNGSGHYSFPDSTTANLCSCSWAAYNLLGACTACQGFDSSIQNWPPYKAGCNAKFLSAGGFPFTEMPLQGAAIPYWAIIDPTTWAGQRFNAAQAKAIADKGNHDVDGPPPKKSSTVGPIVGGVIGGLAAIGLAVGAAFVLKRRKRKQHNQQGAVPGAYGPTHIRSKSDISQTSGTDMNLPYMRIQSPQSFATTQMSHPPMSPGPTLHTRTGSVNSLSYFGSVNGSVTHNASSPPPPPQRHLSPPPPLHHPAMNREDIIVPFTLQPLTSSQDAISRQASNTNLVDRKRADGAIVPVYDSPNAPPQAVRSDEPPIGSTSRRPKMNPPAYSPYPGQQPDDTSSQAPARSRPPHTKQGSSDTQHSWDSNGSGGTAKPSGGGSISAIDDVIGQMGFSANATISGRDGTVATGQSGNLAGASRNPAALINPDDITRHNLA